LYVQGCKALCVWFVFVYDWQKNITFETPIKKTIRGPGYRLSKCSEIIIAIGL
jgi:hypothetical protein